MAFQEYELVIFRRNPEAPNLDAAAVEQNGREHREFLTALRDKGVIVTNGPILDHPDPAVTGMAVYFTGSVDATRKFAEDDPAVKAGRLIVDVMRWRAPEATLRLQGGPVA